MTLSRFFHQLRRHEKGIALVEFAISLPILLLMYLAGYQLQDALSCNRKVTITARAVADLTSQYAILSTAGTDQILNASARVMAPYSASNALVRVTQLYTDDKGNTTVAWSQAVNGTGRAKNSVYTLPATIKTKKTYIILAEVSYAYQPAVNFDVVGPLTLTDTIYMNPRVSDQVQHP